ncbi:response regulator, partial [bacterium]|nr:response regulator [bacterium]
MPNEKILITDDEASIRTALAGRLTANGYTVFQAENGRQGIELARSEEPDMAIIDLQMPEMDGMEMLKHLREEFPELTVVIMSGYGTIEKAVEAMKLGAFDFL